MKRPSASLLPQSRRQWWQVLSVLAFLCCILVGVLKDISPMRAASVLYYVLFPASVAMLALFAFTGGFFRYPEAKLIGLFFLWMLLSTLLRDWHVSDDATLAWYESACVTIFLCFAIPYAFSKAGTLKITRLSAALMIAAVCLLCAVGLFLALSGRTFTSVGGTEIFGMGEDNRLRFLCHPNTVAPLCGMGIVLSVYLLGQSKRWLPRVCLLAALLLCYAALSLTDSRTGILGTGIAVGFEVFLIGGAYLFKKWKALWRILLCALIGIAVLFVTYKGTACLRFAYGQYTLSRLTAQAGAPVQEDPEETAEMTAAEDAAVAASAVIISNRGLANLSTLTGRTDIWKGVLRGLMENPRLLLFGTSAMAAGDTMAPYFPPISPIGNFHNTFLAMLVSFGIPGFLLFLAFLVLLLLYCIKLCFAGLADAATLCTRLVPALIIFTLAECMLEDFLFVKDLPSFIWIWFMFAAGFVFRMRRPDTADTKEVVQ